MKIHISMDTIFEEGIKWDWKANQGASDEGRFHFSTLPDLVVDALDQEPPIQRESAVREDEGGRENSEEISSSQEGDQQRRFKSIQDLYDETEWCRIILEEVSKSYNKGRIYELISMRMMMNI